MLLPRLAALAALAGLAPGCATLVHGGHQYVTVTSRPGGATARAGELRCETPCSLLLPRSRPASLEVEAPGWRTARVPVERSFDPLVLANVLLPPLFVLWAVVDLATGAAWRLDPSFVSVDLRPEPEIALPQPSASCASAAE